jgi:NuA3 HAT complex component NTO1
VSTFSADFGTVFSSAIGLPTIETSSDVQAQMDGTTFAKDLSSEQKRRKLAKRIVKAVQYGLEDATRKESELCRKPFEKELRELDLPLENSNLSRRDSITGSMAGDFSDDEPGATETLENGQEVVMAMTNGETNDDKNIVEAIEEDVRNPQDKGRLAVADVLMDSPQEQVQARVASTSNGLNSEVAAVAQHSVQSRSTYAASFELRRS